MPGASGREDHSDQWYREGVSNEVNWEKVNKGQRPQRAGSALELHAIACAVQGQDMVLQDHRWMQQEVLCAKGA